MLSLPPNTWCVLDTETTGLEPDRELVQLAVLSPSGEVLFGSSLRPSSPIHPQAAARHGLTGSDLHAAPTFAEVYGRVREILRGRLVVAYNAEFDACSLSATCLRYTLPGLPIGGWQCAMTEYAAYCGEWTEGLGGYKWQPLGGNHSALGDCRATLSLIHLMAASAI